MESFGHSAFSCLRLATHSHFQLSDVVNKLKLCPPEQRIIGFLNLKFYVRSWNSLLLIDCNINVTLNKGLKKVNFTLLAFEVLKITSRQFLYKSRYCFVFCLTKQDNKDEWHHSMFLLLNKILSFNDFRLLLLRPAVQKVRNTLRRTYLSHLSRYFLHYIELQRLLRNHLNFQNSMKCINGMRQLGF